MEIDALGPTGDLTWQLMYNENGYYESARGFADLIEELDDTDVDLTNVEEMDVDTIQTELTHEQICAVTAFGDLTYKFASLFNEDIDPDAFENAIEGSDDDDTDGSTGTLSEYPHL